MNSPELQILLVVWFIAFIVWIALPADFFKNLFKSQLTKKYCPYVLKKDFLNKTEKQIFSYLIWSLPTSIIILPQIPLHSIVKTKVWSDRAALNKINKKIIDFWFFNKDMELLALLEFDGPTHNKKDRIQRDNFVDDTMFQLGIPIYHIKYTQSLKAELNEVVNKVKKLVL